MPQHFLLKYFNRWRIALAVFLLVYAILLVHGLDQAPIEWDETNHLNGGLLLFHGEFDRYVRLNAFYPPLDDLLTATFYILFGPSLFSARLLSVMFSLFSLWVLFEFASFMYGFRTAFLSAVLLAVMPGFVNLSRLALIESLLLFFFLLSMALYFVWLKTWKTVYLLFSGAALGLGFLAKYQAVVAVLPMLVSLFVFSRGRRRRITNLPFLFIAALTVALPWVLLVYHVYASGMLQEWFYAIAVGNPQKAQYSSRFPAPVFYLIELTWPYGTVHPISLFLYIIGLTGLAFFTVRRRREDLYLVIWFLSLYAFFTAIGNREWRYMLPVFPVLAVSASSSLTNTAESIRRSKFSKRKRQVLSVLLVTVILAFTTYSCVDAWYWQAKADVHVPVEEAVSYVGQRLVDNESVAVLCPFNLLSQNIVRFTLRAERIQNPVYQYPNLPVDAYTPNFDVEELIQQCVSHNTRYLLLYDNNAEYHFFNTSLTVEKVYDILIKTGRFTLQARVGSSPRTISIIEFSH